MTARDGKAAPSNISDLLSRMGDLGSRSLVGKYRHSDEIKYQLQNAKFTPEKIRKQCTGDGSVVEYISQLKASGQMPTTAMENVVAEKCAITLSKQDILGSLVHEMGHNFGLMHNFMGSSDRANFHSADEIERIYGDRLEQGENRCFDFYHGLCRYPP